MFKTRFLSMLVLLAAVATGAVAQTTYKVSVKEGTEDANKWEIAPAEATTAGVAAGTAVSVKYNGTKKVKSVKAVKKAAAKPAATVATAPTATTGDIAARLNTALVSAGTAEGGTMMYQVTTANTQPTSTDGFSATVPTAASLNAMGTYYVWYYVKADDSHTDSEISATAVAVTVNGIAWNSLPTSGHGTSFSRDGVTLTAEYLYWFNGEIAAWGLEGEFTTTLGNFTKIEITADNFNMSGSGWTVSGQKATWTGSASTVTFRAIDDLAPAIHGPSSMVFYFQPN